MSKAVKKGIRTFVQTALGFVVSSGILVPTDVINVAAIKVVALGAFVSGLAGLAAYVLNALEDSGTVPKTLR